MKPSYHRVLAGCVLAVLLALPSLGCIAESTIDFHVCGDLAVPDDIDALRFLILDSEFDELHSGVRDLVDITLPTTSSLPSGSGAGWARVQGLSQGVAIIVFSRRVGNLEATGRVDMVLTADCLGQDCPVGQTCVSGTCILAPVGAEAPTCGGSF